MLKLDRLTAHKSLNKAYRKVKPNRPQIELFKTSLCELFDGIKENESEEYHKNLASQLLLNTYYKDRFFINTKERTDLAIYNGKESSSTAGVIIEAKKPSNKTEMISGDDVNRKAMHELILYFLRERILKENKELKQIIATNIYEWYIFDAAIFDKLFAQNRKLVNDFKEFESKRLSGYNTDYFYKEIAAPFLAKLDTTISYTHIDLHQYEKIVRSSIKDNDNRLIALYKIFSPEHLLKLPFANDSNNLDKGFYSELLHLIGLEEVKEGGKKLIGRKKEAERNKASLLENAIAVLDGDDCLSNFSQKERLSFGSTKEEQLYNLALELVITWVNRVLFMKLLEGQLVAYHKGDNSYRFLNSKLIGDFDELNKLFFRVLALPEDNRTDEIKAKYGYVPYLNSSLFEPTSIEHKSIRISNLEDNQNLSVLSSTILKDEQGKKVKGALNTLQYLFRFLDAYDFASEGTEDIQEESKTLINASVLGLIFEKINGYKDGSFFTPGFITMYMCRETIRRAVVQKFNENRGWDCKDFNELKEDLTTDIRQNPKGREKVRREANGLINSLRICDPAVGSGHFLVSALNELIAIKSELQILTDQQGQPLNNFNIEVVNDELIISDLDENLFEYIPGNRENQRMQESLFHEKQSLIENCLFGVDINPNSVKICRLRLWIELLKNAYYRPDGKLETLPNIDINIKCGNSLINRYELEADIKKALKDQKMSIEAYRQAVSSYRHAKSKEEKQSMDQLIIKIKQNITSEIRRNDPLKKKYDKLSHELYNRFTGNFLFESEAEYGNSSRKLTKKAQKEQTSLEKEIDLISKKMDEIRNNEIFTNPLEWRFEFPEVLDDDGNFTGFDVVIGNPPYGINLNKDFRKLFQTKFQSFSLRGESYVLFIENAIKLLKDNGLLSYIIPDTILNLDFTLGVRSYILKHTQLWEIDQLPSNVFNDATVDTVLLFSQKRKSESLLTLQKVRVNLFKKKNTINTLKYPTATFFADPTVWQKLNTFNILTNPAEAELIKKIDTAFSPISEFAGVYSGIKVYEVGKGNPPQTSKIKEDKPFTSSIQPGKDWSPFLDGKHIGRYSVTWENNNWIKYGPWLAAPRENDIFLGNKILIRKITSERLFATFITFDAYCNTLLFILKLTNKASLSYQSLLGILNSKFIGWYFKRKYQINETDTFPQIMIKDILQIAIPNENNALATKISILVSEILNINNTDDKKSTTNIEYTVDLLVYKLYQLTWEEVKLVDPEFSLSAEEYNNFKTETNTQNNEN